MRLLRIALMCLLSTLCLTAGCNSGGGGGGKKDPAEPAFSPTRFGANSAMITNMYLPLPPGKTMVLEGESDGERESTVTTVSYETVTILGVECRVIVDREYDEDDELVEETFDWFAQDLDGNVWYFGEASAEYDEGVLVGTDGSWEAGVGGGEAGILIKATPKVGDSYQQEFLPGEAEDMAKVIALDVPVTLMDGTFYRCTKIEEWNPLEPDSTEYKYYAPGVGLVREESTDGLEYLELIETTLDTDPEIDPDDFVDMIDNEFFPLVPGTLFSYEADTDEGLETIDVFVSFATRVVMGVTCIVVEDRVYLDGDLIEETFDWYAQDEDGNVWYFGEDSAEYEMGVLISMDGSWEAGIDGAQPGILMKADPRVGDSYRQEYFEGEAEDLAAVKELGVGVVVPFGAYAGCLKTFEWNPLEDDSEEFKFYAPGVGMVLETSLDGDDRVELISITVMP